MYSQILTLAQTISTLDALPASARLSADAEDAFDR